MISRRRGKCAHGLSAGLSPMWAKANENKAEAAMKSEVTFEKHMETVTFMNWHTGIFDSKTKSNSSETPFPVEAK